MASAQLPEKKQHKSNKDKAPKNQAEAEEFNLEEIDDRIEGLKETYNEMVESQTMIYQFKIVSTLLSYHLSFYPSLIPDSLSFCFIRLLS